jgi:prepilin-type N-terminal cleavage/methylation domain-containing protein
MIPIRGFTLIEILIVLGMLALLSTVVLVAVNPLRQFAQARNTQREANVSALLNAVGHRLADNRGIFESASSTCSSSLPASAIEISKAGYDLRPCLVPEYLPELPFDPAEGDNTCVSEACDGLDENYATNYTIAQNTVTARITICAPGHVESALPNSSAFCLTR